MDLVGRICQIFGICYLTGRAHLLNVTSRTALVLLVLSLSVFANGNAHAAGLDLICDKKSPTTLKYFYPNSTGTLVGFSPIQTKFKV